MKSLPLKFLSILVLTLSFTCNTRLNAQIISMTVNDTSSNATTAYDINNDSINDFQFSFTEVNPGQYQTSIQAQGGSEFLDNSPSGFPDTLNFGDSLTGSYSSSFGWLNTLLTNDGQFADVGFKYLGIKIASGADFHYGWFKLSFNSSSNTLIIESYAYNSVANSTAITAGQETVTSTNNKSIVQIDAYPNPAESQISIPSKEFDNADFSIYNVLGTLVLQGKNEGTIDISNLENGNYLLLLESEQKQATKRISVVH